MIFYPGQIVETDKMGFRHEGLVVDGMMVIHSTPDHGGVTISTLASFSGAGGARASMRYNPKVSPQQMIYNAYRQLQMKRPWYPWNNCQHFISEIAGLKKESYQLQEIMISLIFLSGVFIYARGRA